MGAVLLSLVFVPEFGVVKGLYYGLWHSISAFCNAGFDVIGPNSLIPYQTNIPCQSYNCWVNYCRWSWFCCMD